MTRRILPSDWPRQVEEAITFFWATREQQATKQQTSGRADQGARSAVTGGAQMNGFVTLLRRLILDAGVLEEHVYSGKKTGLQLPGYYRPTKEWDIVVVQHNQLVLAIEVKSQTGPSFGNNFNNRTEEAMGSSLDLWTAFREGAYNSGSSVRPWLGYLFLLQDCADSRKPVTAREPHFKVFPEFKSASYSKRYEHFCRRLVRERQYDAACFILSPREAASSGQFQEPASDLTFEGFARAMIAHASAFIS